MNKFYFILSSFLLTTFFFDNTFAAEKKRKPQKETIAEINDRAANRSLRMKIFKEAGAFKAGFVKKFKELIGDANGEYVKQKILVYQFDEVFSKMLEDLKNDVNSENIASGEGRGDSSTSTQQAFKEKREEILSLKLPQAESDKKLLLLDLYGIDFNKADSIFNGDVEDYNKFIKKYKNKLQKYLMNKSNIGAMGLNVEKLAKDLIGANEYNSHKEKINKMIDEYKVKKNSPDKEVDYMKKTSRSKLK